MIPAEAVEATGPRPEPGEGRSIWNEIEAKGIEYKSPEYWAYLQDGAGKK